MKLLVVLFLALLLLDCGKKRTQPPRPAPTPAPTAQPTVEPSAQPTVEPTPSSTPVVMPTPPIGVLNPAPAPTPFTADAQAIVSGEDLGIAINAAQKPGVREVLVTQSGVLTTPAIIERDTRLRLAEGVTITAHTTGIPFQLKEGASIVGAGMSKSVIVESSVKGQWVVVAGYYGTESNGAPDFDILLQGFEVRGSEARAGDWNSAPQAIQLGNCKNCRAEDLWLNATHSIGLQVGGGGLHFTPAGPVRQYADLVKVLNCRFTRVASQPLALVNGQDIELAYNWIEASGQEGGPGSHPIDLEINQIEDRLLRVRIHHNWIDSRQSTAFGNGIIVQAGEKIPEIGDITVEHNVLVGGVLAPATNRMSTGIYVFGPAMKDVTVRFNRVWRTGHGCFNVNGAGIVVTDNECVDTGGGGIPGATAIHLRSSPSRKSEVTRNTFQHLGDGSADGRLMIIDSPELTLGENRGFAVVREQQ